MTIRRCLPILVLTLASFAATCSAQRLGVNPDGIGGRGLEFVDAMKTSRAWEKPDGRGPARVDESGWPLEDARTVVFDMRPAFAWAPPMDDPDAYQIDVSGTYTLTFVGRADVSAGTFPLRILGQDSKANRTTAEVTLPKGQALLILSFTNTNGGVKDVHLYRPGAKPGSAIFTDSFLNAVKLFPVVRFMDWLDSNSTNPFFGDKDNTTEWSDRHLVTDCSYARRGKKFGAPWEIIISLANTTHQDIWLNIPVAASDDYVRKLALLVKSTLNPRSKIYLEYSNEVWNWGFLQATYNRMAAEAEVKSRKSDLNNDGEKNWDVWRRRRVARRTMEIGRIFSGVLGNGGRIRPVLAWWVIAPDQYADMLQWLEKTYGAPSKYLYAIAGAPYFNIQGAPKDAGVDALLEAFRRSSDASVKWRKGIIGVAQKYGLKAFCYEGGSDTGGGDKTNVANRIRAERDPRMTNLILHDLKDNWFDLGGDLFMYFTLTSGYSRYGCWGLTDDVTKLNTPKFKAVRSLLSGN